ncbi:uncharacterized protein TRUGW13939_02067 [Talaromyces rugulosus]|uniref:Uncharacterized protein n=1 Tax=Talaromyces rugulosus TaxID=121627 RepID=A0A7H8QM11_TALRU|nr:uncharacterized protein TRUGW13939_02067 [Talaromyces rugulosus]QKX54977.1 hypothetical protein TRUGW13939_02067 [Talaromyces rugulosus]
MFAPKTLVAVLATMATIASAAPAVAASGTSTSFQLGNGNPVTKKDGCILEVISEHGSGVNAVIVLDGIKNCDKVTTKVSGPAGNGTAGVDFSLSPPGAFFIQTDYLAQCNITNMACKAAY